MEEKILEMCLTGMSAYKKAEGSMELADASDIMAEVLEEIMRIISERNPEVADEVDNYFKKYEQT